MVVLTLAQVYYGPPGGFGNFYYLILALPMVFYPLRWALGMAALVAGGSLVPFLLQPGASEARLRPLTIAVPLYFIITLLGNRLIEAGRVEWLDTLPHRRQARELVVCSVSPR